MLHQPRLLLLDEPTAGVDRRRGGFLGTKSIAFRHPVSPCSSTHYMDGAERCRRLAYNRLWRCFRGTAAEVVASQQLFPIWEISATACSTSAMRCAAVAGAELVASFGTALHVSGRDARCCRPVCGD